VRAVLLVLVGFAVVTALLAWSRWLAHRPWRAAGNLVLAVSSAVAVLLLLPVVQHLSGYDEHRIGQPVAEIFLERVGTGRYRATLTYLPGGRMQVFELPGDEWRLELRTLDWNARIAALGLAPVCRLERLISRTAAPQGTQPTAGASYLLGAARGTDIWARARAGKWWAELLDADLLEGPWQPITHGARFEVHTDASALAVRQRSGQADRDQRADR
jgi:hypothetical protein